MKEVKVSESVHAITGIEKKDISGLHVMILRNGIPTYACPISLIEKMGDINFPDNPILFDKNKDEIRIAFRKL